MSKDNRTVKLRHATPRRNLKSIFSQGVCPWYAKGRLRVCWLHSPAQTERIRDHVARRHGVDPSDVVVIEVELPRGLLRRFKRGLWTTPARVWPQQITGVNGLRLCRSEGGA